MGRVIHIKKIFNQTGASLLLSTLVLVSIGVLGLQTVQNSGLSTAVSGSSNNNKEAESLAQGGIEAALLKLASGLDPTQSYSLNSSGNNTNLVTITTNPNQSEIIVHALAENGDHDAERTYTLNAEFSKDRVSLNADHASFSTNLLQGLYLEKTGTKPAIIDKIKVTWNQSFCARLVTCPNPTSDEAEEDDEPGCWSAPASWTPYEDPTNNKKVLICHSPPGNPDNRHTISVNKNAVHTHYCHHDDALGPCSVTPPTPEPVYVSCDETDLSDAQNYMLNDFCSVSSGGRTTNRVIMNGSTTVFQAGSVPTPSTTAVGSGVWMDIQNVTMNLAGNYTLDSIRFSSNISDATWYTVDVLFLDGSTTTGTFQVRTYNVNTSGMLTQQSDVEHGEDYTTEDEEGDKTGEVTIYADNNYVFTLETLGVLMTCGEGGPSADVTVRVRINDTFNDAFDGEATIAGDLYTVDNLMEENDYAIEATATLEACNDYEAVVLSTDTDLVKLLVDGDPVPDTLSGFGGQEDVSEILAAYISGNEINLPQNKVIVLFELGNDSDSKDFQDYAGLITITNQ